ncbi:hypothetical protein MKEN_00045900 [Mycena kentingensis (nom. inval.)]|nr:hypothetical protein MKEN_00045900 [Mycena kentingensis (nom. inval.)]
MYKNPTSPKPPLAVSFTATMFSTPSRKRSSVLSGSPTTPSRTLLLHSPARLSLMTPKGHLLLLPHTPRTPLSFLRSTSRSPLNTPSLDAVVSPARNDPLQSRRFGVDDEVLPSYTFSLPSLIAGEQNELDKDFLLNCQSLHPHSNISTAPVSPIDVEYLPAEVENDELPDFSKYVHDSPDREEDIGRRSATGNGATRRFEYDKDIAGPLGPPLFGSSIYNNQLQSRVAAATQSSDSELNAGNTQVATESELFVSTELAARTSPSARIGDIIDGILVLLRGHEATIAEIKQAATLLVDLKLDAMAALDITNAEITRLYRIIADIRDQSFEMQRQRPQDGNAAQLLAAYAVRAASTMSWIPEKPDECAEKAEELPVNADVTSALDQTKAEMVADPRNSYEVATPCFEGRDGYEANQQRLKDENTDLERELGAVRSALAPSLGGDAATRFPEAREQKRIEGFLEETRRRTDSPSKHPVSRLLHNFPEVNNARRLMSSRSSLVNSILGATIPLRSPPYRDLEPLGTSLQLARIRNKQPNLKSVVLLFICVKPRLDRRLHIPPIPPQLHLLFAHLLHQSASQNPPFLTTFLIPQPTHKHATSSSHYLGAGPRYIPPARLHCMYLSLPAPDSVADGISGLLLSLKLSTSQSARDGLWSDGNVGVGAGWAKTTRRRSAGQLKICGPGPGASAAPKLTRMYDMPVRRY